MAVPPPLPSLVAAAITSLSCLPLLTSLHLQSNARIEYTVMTAMTSMSGSMVARREKVGRINIATDDAEADNDGAWPFVFPPPFVPVTGSVTMAYDRLLCFCVT